MALLTLLAILTLTGFSASTLQDPPPRYIILDLHRNNSDFINQTNQWTFRGTYASTANTTPKYSLCAGTYLVKGYNTNYPRLYVDGTYTSLPAHQAVFITMTFWLIDQWTSSSYFEIYIKNSTSSVFLQTVGKAVSDQNTWTEQLCGSSSYYELEPVIITTNANHSDSVLTLGVYQYYTDTAQLGIRNVQILLSNYTLSNSASCGLTTPSNLLLSPYNCACDSGQYSDSTTGLCTSCNPSCSSCFGPNPTDCSACSYGYSYNGTHCILCDTTCETCFGSSAHQCFTCYSGYYLNWDNTCIPDCTAPFIKNQTVANYYCNTPCNSSQYYYTNGSCLSTCSGEFSQLKIRSSLICDFSCPAGSYLYTNDSCITSCDSPRLIAIVGGYSYCSPPCMQSEYLYSNGSCSNSCPSPRNALQYEDIQICQDVCGDSGEYYYLEKQVCKPICPRPYIVTQTSYGETCTLPVSQDDANEADEAMSIVSFSNKTGTIIQAGLLLVAIINPFDTSVITGSALSRMLEYTKYINVSHSTRLERIFQADNPRTSGFQLQAIQMSQATQTELDYNSSVLAFTRYDLGSSFLLNFWNNMVWLVLIVGVLIAFIILERLIMTMVEKDRVRWIFRKARVTSQNYLIDQLYDSCPDIILYCGLELWSSDFQHKIRRMSIFAALVCFLIALYQLRFHFRLVKKYQKIKNRAILNYPEEDLKKYEDQHEGVKVLFEEFKSASFLQQGFLLIFITRGMFFSLLVTMAFSYPLAQASVITSLNLVFLGYMILKTPFKTRFYNFRQTTYEIVLLIANFSIIGTAILDRAGMNSVGLTKRTSNIIIACNLLANILPIIFMVITLILKGMALYRYIRNHRIKQVIPVLQEISHTNNIKSPEKTKELDLIDFNQIKIKPLAKHLDVDSKANSAEHLHDSHATVAYLESPSKIEGQNEKAEVHRTQVKRTSSKKQSKKYLIITNEAPNSDSHQDLEGISSSSVPRDKLRYRRSVMDMSGQLFQADGVSGTARSNSGSAGSALLSPYDMSAGYSSRRASAFSGNIESMIRNSLETKREKTKEDEKVSTAGDNSLVLSGINHLQETYRMQPRKSLMMTYGNSILLKKDSPKDT